MPASWRSMFLDLGTVSASVAAGSSCFSRNDRRAHRYRLKATELLAPI